MSRLSTSSWFKISLSFRRWGLHSYWTYWSLTESSKTTPCDLSSHVPCNSKIISLAKEFQETFGNYKYSILLHNNHKSLEQSNSNTFSLHQEIQLYSSKHLKWVSFYLLRWDGLHIAVSKHHQKYQMYPRAILLCTSERKWSGLSSPFHTWTNLYF